MSKIKQRPAKIVAIAAVLLMALALFAACSTQPDDGDQAGDGQTQITLADADTTFVGEGAVLDGNNVLISAGGVYHISGQLAAGGIIVDAANEEVELILDGVDISNPNGPAILFMASEDARVVLAAGQENNLSDGEGSDYDAVLYGIPTITIDGEGSLNVTANVEEGIASDANVVIDGGEINITAPDDGINGSEDGVSEVIINGGMISIIAGGDAIDSNGSITINGGTVLAYATMEDASGGLDADGEIIINGGVVLATGASNSYPTGGEQKYLSFRLAEQQAAGSTISIEQDGTQIFSAVVEQAYQDIVFSSADIADDVTYTIYIDDQQVAEIDTASNNAGGPGMGGEMPEGMEPPTDGEMPTRPQGEDFPTDGEMPDRQMPEGDGQVQPSV